MALLAGRSISKSYGAQCALAGVDFEIDAGRITGLVGANGAGKSTLLKIIAGAIAPDSGELALEGKSLTLGSMREAARLGIALVSQELSLFPALTIRENLEMIPAVRTASERSARDQAARRILSELGLDVPLHTKLEQLPLADRQLVEIGRGLLLAPKLLILDEPTSALRPREKTRLNSVLRRLAESGVAILYVSHFLEELLAIADCLLILRDGRRIETDVRPGAQNLRQVVAAMLGAPAADASLENATNSRQTAAASGGCLQFREVAGAIALQIPEWSVAPGKVVGVAGLPGAGVEELFATLFGRLRPRHGEILLPSGKSQPRSIAEAVRSGVAYVPSDRKRIGLMLRQSVAENVCSVRSLTQNRDGFFLSRKSRRETAQRQCLKLGMKTGALDQAAITLSGGNQQKIVFAKWQVSNPSLVLLDDPTRGVDIGAKREVHRLIHKMAADGRVVLMASSDPLELVSVADEVHAFVGGRIAASLSGDQMTEHNLISAINIGAAGYQEGL